MNRAEVWTTYKGMHRDCDHTSSNPFFSNFFSSTLDLQLISYLRFKHVQKPVDSQSYETVNDIISQIIEHLKTKCSQKHLMCSFSVLLKTY